MTKVVCDECGKDLGSLKSAIYNTGIVVLNEQHITFGYYEPEDSKPDYCKQCFVIKMLQAIDVFAKLP